MAEVYEFKPHERPIIPGSPFNPDHPTARMVAYGLIGILAGLTGGLGNALITSNLGYFQGTLGLSAVEAAWIPAAYVATNICANLILVKFREEFGLHLFLRIVLVGYVLVTLTHLFVHSFWSVMLVRAISGIAAAGLTTLGVLAWFQAMPAPKRLVGVILGVSIPQLATPLSRVIAPGLLEWGDWRMTYVFELGLSLLTLAAMLLLPLPPSIRGRAFERADFITIGLLFPGVGLLCAVLALGRILWWTSTPWIGCALIAALFLISAGTLLERGRANPLLASSFLAQKPIITICALAFCIRVTLAEQTFGTAGLLSSLGFGEDQLRDLYLLVTLASLAGLGVTLVAFRPETPARPIQLACIVIASAALLDSGSTNLIRPADLYVSQALIGFGALLFIGPAMVIGLSRALIAGPRFFISWLVIFLGTQNLGGLAGAALWGTLQTSREKFHSHSLIDHIILGNPIDAARFAATTQQLSPVVTDPALRAAQGAALISRKATAEANILAYNDIFLTIAACASVLFLWCVAVECQMRRRGEVSPIVRLVSMMRTTAVREQEQRL